MDKRIDMTLPLSSECLVAARLTAGAVCNILGLDIEEADDVKLCVSEACNLIFAQHFGAASIRFSFEKDLCVEIRGDQPSEGPDKEVDEDMSRLLLKDIPYIATNPDWVCPTEFGYVPDCGSMSEMLCHATGKMPTFIGKPSPLMPKLAMEKWGYTPEESMVIGDRIYTDIKSGLNAGIAAALVLSGETTPEILARSEDKPTVVFSDCGELLQQLQAQENNI